MELSQVVEITFVTLYIPVLCNVILVVMLLVYMPLWTWCWSFSRLILAASGAICNRSKAKLKKQLRIHGILYDSTGVPSWQHSTSTSCFLATPGLAPEWNKGSLHIQPGVYAGSEATCSLVLWRKSGHERIQLQFLWNCSTSKILSQEFRRKKVDLPEWHRIHRTKSSGWQKRGMGWMAWMALDTVEFRPGIGQASTTEFRIHRTQEWSGGRAQIASIERSMSKIWTKSPVLQVAGAPSPDMQRSVSRRVHKNTQRNLWENHDVWLWSPFYCLDCMIGTIFFATLCSNWWFHRFHMISSCLLGKSPSVNQWKEVIRFFVKQELLLRSASDTKWQRVILTSIDLVCTC